MFKPEYVLWVINFLLIFETIFQLEPLIKGKPLASRKASLVGASKYLATMLVNLWMGNLAMSVWLMIGLGKEIVAFMYLRELKGDLWE